MRTIAMAVALAVLALPAMAQTPKKKPDILQNIQEHLQQGSGENSSATPPTSTQKGDLLQYLADDAIKKILPDLQYSTALAHQNKNVITAPCLDAILGLIQGWQAPVYPYVATGAAQPASPQALTMPNPHLIVVLERTSELIQQLQPNSTISLGCAPLATAAQKDIATLVGTVLSGGAVGLLKLPIVPLP
jgi:hypothetical protein